MKPARGCPSSTCISLVWLDRCNIYIYISLSLSLSLYYCILSCIPIDCSLTLTFTIFSRCWPGLDRSLDVMSILVSVALFYTMTNTLSWDLPGDALAAPAPALYGWNGVDKQIHR